MGNFLNHFLPKADDLAVWPIAQWIQTSVQWVALHLRPFFILIKWPVEQLLGLTSDALHATPFPVVVVILFLLGWRLASLGVGVFCVVSSIVIAMTGVWADAMTTLALIATAIVFCALIGIPVGIACARSNFLWRIVRPVLDVMQTTPTFVYLVPVVMLFGVGTVPGEVAVVTTAMPPLIRFTQLGIRMVDHEIVEAGLAFGADSRQLLWEIQLPLAIPTILGGLNQTVLTAMVMSVVVAMIGAEGLGLVVLQGLGRLDVGQGAIGGLGIVLLAMMLDRITQGVARTTRASRPSLFSAITRLVRGERSHGGVSDARTGAVSRAVDPAERAPDAHEVS